MGLRCHWHTSWFIVIKSHWTAKLFKSFMNVWYGEDWLKVFLDVSGITFSDCIIVNYCLSLFLLASHIMNSLAGFFLVYQMYCQVLVWLEQLYFHLMVLVFVPSALAPLFAGCNRSWFFSLIPSPFCFLYMEFVLIKSGHLIATFFLLIYIILAAPELHHRQVPQTDLHVFVRP